MTMYAEGDVVRLSGERNRRYVVERIRLNGEVDVRGENGLRTVASVRIIADPVGPRPVTASAPPAPRRGAR